MKLENLILAINPGSTSTKIAIFNCDKEVFVKNIKHETHELEGFKKITDQYEFRKNIILNELKNNNFDLNFIKIIV